MTTCNIPSPRLWARARKRLERRRLREKEIERDSRSEGGNGRNLKEREWGSLRESGRKGRRGWVGSIDRGRREGGSEREGKRDGRTDGGRERRREGPWAG